MVKRWLGKKDNGSSRSTTASVCQNQAPCREKKESFSGLFLFHKSLRKELSSQSFSWRVRAVLGGDISRIIDIERRFFPKGTR